MHSSPVAIARRSASRSKFVGLNAAGAASEAKDAFPALIEQTAGGTPSLTHGARILSYPTDHAAVVSLPGGAKGLIEASAPIARRSGRHHIPLDLRLTDRGGRFAPVSSNLDLDVPKDIADGIALANLGVSLTPAGPGGTPLAGSQGALDGVAAVWRHSGGAADARDLESIAKATSLGFDLTTMLLSDHSPSKLYYRVGVPHGARLHQTSSGAITVSKGKDALAEIMPVSAEDAEGASVPVVTNIHGHIVELSLDLSGEHLYPIAVDPEVNDSELVRTAAGKHSNWEFKTTNAGRFGKAEYYEGPGAERLETKGIAPYEPTEFGAWGYQTKGVSHIYEIKTQTSAHNKGSKIESALEFLEPSSARETRKLLSTEANPEYENKATTACAANASKVEECLPGSGKANNAVVFEQLATANPGGSYGFSDSMSQGIVSIAEPTGTHAATRYNTTSPTVEVEIENEHKEKEKVSRTNVLYGSGAWLSKLGGSAGGALGLVATDPGIGVSATKLEYEFSPGVWTPLEEHGYLAESGCQGVQCYVEHTESWRLNALLPDGEQKLRYRAEEAMPGTQSLTTEGLATVKVDSKKPHNLEIDGLPYGNELSERGYKLEISATDGEGTVSSSGIKSIKLSVDGHEVGTPSGSCTTAKGPCTATVTQTLNGAALGAGKHDIEIVAIDNAGNEAKGYEPITIRHSTPVALGPGSVDLESGDFALGASDVSMGSGLNLSRNSSSRNLTQGGAGPLGPEWNMSIGTAESLQILVDGSVLMTAADGKQTIFAAHAGKFESPTGDSTVELSVEENETTKQPIAYYLKNASAHTSLKFTQQAGSEVWLPTQQEGTVATDTLTYSYTQIEAQMEYKLGTESRPRDLITGSDGDLWYSTSGTYGEAFRSGRIGRMSPTGAVAEFAIPSFNEARGMAVGPEGNVWFAEGTKYAKITHTGVITEYSLPEFHSADAFVVGAEGNLWLTESYGAEGWIAKISPTTGAILATYAAKGAGEAITLGPEGNLWFPKGEHVIARMTTAGALTEFTTGATRLAAITTGPDKNMWFADREGQKVGKITPTGVVTEYTVPGKMSPWSISVGPDGNLWFAMGEDATGYYDIGKVTTAGVVTTYPIGWGTYSIDAGPDGKVWFPTIHGIRTTTPTNKIAVPQEIQAPVPAGVSCSPEPKPGCRSLYFQYWTEKSATGEGASEWGKYPGRLGKVYLRAYNKTTAKMEFIAVAEYSYDILGRLRAEWDPRISPALKTTYGYDAEGHVTAVSPPGQQPWTLTYGAISGDTGTGRLLKAARAPAGAELWKGAVAANTTRPLITGGATEGVMLSVSKGSWSGGPIHYGYQWSRCTSATGCVPIPGATNETYKVVAADVGATLLATVEATNGGGSVAANTTQTATVKTSASWVTEYSLPAGSGPRGLTPGPEVGSLWFTDYSTNKIGKTTYTGAITEYALPAGSRPQAIVKGPDGNLWFTDNEKGAIGKITTAGVVTEYALPAGSAPYGITEGQDGNLWFGNKGNNKIGKITTTGTITEYAQTGKGPWGIVEGPDGANWFTDATSNKIGRITTAGVVSEYTLPAGSTPEGIVNGPGGLWFAEAGSHKIGKITTAGTITEYSLPGTIVPTSITTSTSGNLWVTGSTSHELVRVSSLGAMTEFMLPAEAKPEQAATNSVGEMWYTSAGNKLGRIAGGSLNDGEAWSPESGETLNYNVPLRGTGAPWEMGESEVAKWGQSDVPVEATAITAADEAQGWPASSYKRATVHYLDEQGREVNVASPSNATYGSISTTEYNEYNDVIRTLTPDNRATALAAGASSVEKSKLLDTQSTFNGEGAKEGEVAEPGSMLVETFGPQHQIKYRTGGEVKESLARDHTKFVYDQGAPAGETYHLVTEQYDLAELVNEESSNHEELEVRTMKKSYSGQSNLGWKLRAPTSVTVDPGGLKQTTTTEYNPTTAQIAEVRGAGAETTLTYASKFGEAGTEAGKLKSPWGVALNATGTLWVVDSANNRLQSFSAAGVYAGGFGEAGSGNGQFNAPEGVAMDSAKDIWVADTGNNRIQEFTSAGVYKATVGSLGTEPGKLKAPSAIAFDAKGDLWVADTGNNRIEEFSSTGTFMTAFGSAGSEPGKLSGPEGIAIDSAEHVWVADTGNNRIQEFSATGTLLKRFGTAGAGEGQLNAPIDLKIDSLGNIWTVDSQNNRAESFSPSGAYVTQLGWTGTGAGQLTGPRALVFNAGGELWVTDSSDNRLERWAKGPNAHDQKTIYYGTAANSEYPSCGGHPEWAGLVCETLPAKQPELMGLPKLPVTLTTYNTFNEPETITETFGTSTRTKKEAYDAAGRKISSEATAFTGVSLPKVNFTYNAEQGILEKQTTEGEGKVLAGEFNHLGQLVKYTDADGNVAKYKYAGPEGDLLPQEITDSSASGTTKQKYEYEPTTKQRTKLIDSAAGSFTGSYDAEGKLRSVSYPYGMCANYSYNSVGESTSVSYIKSSNCSEGEAGTYYSDTRLSSIHGEMLSQASTLAEESYVYDTAGRLTESQETPTGEGCTVRAYAYDEEGDRESSVGRTPGVGGVCQAEGGTIESHNYDEGNRLADGGMAYDGLGNVTKLPAADAEGKELTSTFYVDNAVATQTQGGTTNEYKLDPEGRVRETITGAVTTKSHYDGPGATPAWTESAGTWTRNIPGIDGALVATQTSGATPVIQLHDLQGNVVGTIGDKAGETKLLSSYNSTEFGVPNAGKAPPTFAWLGADGIQSTFSTGVITYGSTSYVPQTGRALQSEQVEAPGLGGGSGLGAPYVMQEEPWVMQGIAAAAAEAPGLEAAREREAYGAGMKDPWTQQFLNLQEALSKGEEFDEAESSVVVLSMFDLPEHFIEVLGKIGGEEISEFADAYKWMYDAGEKLIKCSQNHRNLHHCRFEYDENEWTPSVEIPLIGVTLTSPITFTWPNWEVEPQVYECKFFPQGGHECPNKVSIHTEL
ncbi:MAG TPA: hypothetical protein VGG08_06215 [Solirubrobacteraceae bacterium]